MKVKQEIADAITRSVSVNQKIGESIVNELNYTMGDINSYQELTESERKIWTQEVFEKVFE